MSYCAPSHLSSASRFRLTLCPPHPVSSSLSSNPASLSQMHSLSLTRFLLLPRLFLSLEARSPLSPSHSQYLSLSHCPHTHKHTRTHTNTHWKAAGHLVVHLRIYIYMHTHTHTHTHRYIFTYMVMCVCVCVCVCMCVYIYGYMCVCVCVCVCVFFFFFTIYYEQMNLIIYIQPV